MTVPARPEDVLLNRNDLAASAFLASYREPTRLEGSSQPDESVSVGVNIWIVMTAVSAAVTAVAAVVSLVLR